MTRMLLIRHGQSVWNATGRWQGQANPPLSQLGHDQAEAAAAGLNGVDAIATSDLVRAHQTATTLASAAGIGHLTVDARLRERHAGEWQGLTRAEIEDGYPGYLDTDRRPPGWESASQLRERAMAALTELASAHKGATYLVVTHAGVIYSVEEANGYPHERIANLGGRWLQISNGAAVLGDRVNLTGGQVTATVPDQI